MIRPYRASQKFYEPLALVCTIAEVCQRWGRSRSTVRSLIDREIFAAVQSGKTWLVSVPSVAAYWGEPPHPTEPEQPLQGAKTALQKTYGSGSTDDDLRKQTTTGTDADNPLPSMPAAILRKAQRREILRGELPPEILQAAAEVRPKAPSRTMQKTRPTRAPVKVDKK